MSSAHRLRELAKKCDELAKNAPNDEIRQKQQSLAESYRSMASREDWLESWSTQKVKIPT
jgi:hypothetical protein